MQSFRSEQNAGETLSKSVLAPRWGQSHRFQDAHPRHIAYADLLVVESVSRLGEENISGNVGGNVNIVIQAKASARRFPPFPTTSRQSPGIFPRMVEHFRRRRLIFRSAPAFSTFSPLPSPCRLPNPFRGPGRRGLAERASGPFKLPHCTMGCAHLSRTFHIKSMA